jgi:hypothetical protein
VARAWSCMNRECATEGIDIDGVDIARSAWDGDGDSFDGEGLGILKLWKGRLDAASYR